LITKGEVIGALQMGSTESNVYSQRHLGLAERVGNQIARAIENARLFQENRELGVLEERNRVAREIHDTLAQGFTGIVLQLEAAEQAIEETPDEVSEHLGRAKGLARESLQEARRSVWDLVPRALEERSLDHALRDEVSEFAAAGRERATFSIDGTRRDLPTGVQRAVLRICQESLTNARRHAEAATVNVKLSFDPGAVHLEIRDDGRGFDPDALHSTGERRGFGLIGMEQRARLLNGSLSLSSHEGEGTRIKVTIPTG
jgi:signal transduction histidine kinase